MSEIRIIDLDVRLPPGVSVLQANESLGRVRVQLEGDACPLVSEFIRSAGLDAGYEIVLTKFGFYLIRGEQRIGVFAAGVGKLHILIDDAERLPLASVTRDGIAVGRVSLVLEGVNIVPQRERYDSDLATRIGQWRIVGMSAEALSASIVKSLGSSGMTAWGPFAPRDAEIGDTWTSEAFDAQTLIKISATQCDGYVTLEIELIESASRDQDH